ncbi:type IV fimbrial biogenesis protein FimT [Povalibacter uvarum]|uniref:Type II secretion system protein H n=1 Tax=Povalibacter uvarum TaxID=732238 RepID=A0A841HG30_9GAMM|nr:GspH/FimT family pseudopilin [Povalibacter uvarum]MBB6091847.1 type IV fimbrial biogenesis protein FimT [Povalibacter uvarum]
MNNISVIRAPNAVRGFTLIELMVTLSVAALLIGLAAPSFREIRIRNELSTYANELISSINLARSEAVRRGRPVVICPSTNSSACGGTWSEGWITFADLDGNGERNAADENERVLKAQGPVSANYSIDGEAFPDGLTYKADGSTESTGLFVICNQGRINGARAVVITPMRPRVATDADEDGVPNNDASGNITTCESGS